MQDRRLIVEIYKEKPYQNIINKTKTLYLKILWGVRERGLVINVSFRSSARKSTRTVPMEEISKEK